MEIWEPRDLNISTHSATDAEAEKEMVFGKLYNSYVPVYVPTFNRSYLTIHWELFSELIGDELGKVYDCYIAYFGPLY